MMDIFEGAKEFSSKLARAINSSKSIRLISHLDADGITSAAIVVKFLKSKNKEFHLTIVKQLTDREIKMIDDEDYDLYIITDLGSGKINELERLNKEIYVIDHHQIFGKPKRVHLFNPYLFGLNGSTDACGATCTYLVFKSLGLEDSAYLAIVGAIGDNQEDENGLIGINRWVLENTDEVEMKKGLKVFGRKSKPIHTALSQSEVQIPGISGDESKTVQFLSEIGIKIKDENGFRTLSDLSEDESKKLIKEIIIKGMSSNEDLNKLFGYVYDIKKRNGILSDAREFATLLNSFGRQGMAGEGVEICLGNDNNKLIENVLKDYRKKIIESIKWIKQNMKSRDGIEYVIAEDNVPDTMIGTIISMLIRGEHNTIIGLANSDGNVKVSIRTKDEDLNLGKIMEDVAGKVGGEGGGHKKAAGASIPKGKEEEFINLVIEEITWQKGKLEGKRYGSQ